MIPASSQFIAANAVLFKEPVYLLKIPRYKRQFSTLAGQISDPTVQIGVQTIDFGGLADEPTPFTLKQELLAGDLIFVFIYYAGTFGVEAIAGVTDTAGNTYTLLYSGPPGDNLTVYVTTSVAFPAGNVISVNGASSGAGFLAGGNFEIYGAVVDGGYSGYHFAAGHGASNISLTAGSTTVGWTESPAWQAALVELAPASAPYGAVTLLFVTAAAAATMPNSLAAAGVAGAATVLAGSLTCDDWIKNIDPLKLAVTDMDGASNLADLTLNVLDWEQLITADLPGITLEGKEAFLKHGYVGLGVGYWITMFRGIVNMLESDNGNTEYKFTISSFNLKKLTTKVYTTGDDGFTTSTKHPRNILGHPLDILVSVLQQAGIALADIDTNKIHFYRDTIFNGLPFQFKLTSAPNAKDFLEQELMKPLGMYLWENNVGQVSINSFYPALSGSGGYTPPTPPVDTIDNDAQAIVPVVAEADLINQIAMKFDDDGNGNQSFQSENIATYNPSVAKYGMTDAYIIESQGMRSSFQGYFIAAFVSRLIFLRYGLKNLVLDPTPLLWNHCRLEPGDIVAYTEPFMPDRKAGVLGVTAQTFEVLDRTWDFMAGVITLKLLALDISKFKQYLITPNSESNYTLASPTDKAKYMFQCNDSDQYSNGDPAHTLG